MVSFRTVCRGSIPGMGPSSGRNRRQIWKTPVLGPVSVAVENPVSPVREELKKSGWSPPPGIPVAGSHVGLNQRTLPRLVSLILRQVPSSNELMLPVYPVTETWTWLDGCSTGPSGPSQATKPVLQINPAALELSRTRKRKGRPPEPGCQGITNPVHVGWRHGTPGRGQVAPGVVPPDRRHPNRWP